MSLRTRSILPLVVLATLVVGCLPETVGPPRSTSPIVPGTSATTSPGPTGPTPRPSFVPPTPTPMPTFFIHTVVPGDSLVAIARRYRTTGRSIAYWNRTTYPSLDPDSPTYSPNRIEVGWTLALIPGVEVNPDDLPEPTGSAAPS
jgi:hypothetical protein